MKIGFIKLGLKTYFTKNGTGQGSNHELVDTFDIFNNNGHECFMLSTSDLHEVYKGEVDWLFVFNGPMNMYGTSFMGDRYLHPYIKLIDNSKAKFAYFRTDPRKSYDIMSNKLFKRKPDVIFDQGENYAHLDKLVLYKKKFVETSDVELTYKHGELVVLQNDTDKKRSKLLLKHLNWIKQWHEFKLFGKWKDVDSTFLPEEEVLNTIKQYKFGYNIGVDNKWVSQKYWEMILAEVVCFYHNYDSLEHITVKDDFRRVDDEYDLEEKLTLVKKDSELYQDLLAKQRSELKPCYTDGSLVYNTITKKLCLMS